MVDRHILYELGKNARQSAAQLERKVGARKEVVNYRINNLLNAGAIFRSVAILDPGRLGYTLTKVMLKLENAGKEKKSELVAFLASHPLSLWTVECDGPFDVGFMLFARNAFELDDALRRTYNRYSDYINRKELSTNVRGEYFERRYLVSSPSALRKGHVYGGKPERVNVDETDWSILRCLAEDARMPATEIAQRVPIGADAVRQRIGKLERKGAISGYSIILDNAAIHQFHYKILVHLRDLSDGTFLGLRQFCIKNSNIVYLIKSMGSWDVELDLEVGSVEQYRDIMLELAAALPGAIKSYDALLIYKIHQVRV